MAIIRHIFGTAYQDGEIYLHRVTNESGVRPWPGRCSGYGWLLFVMQAKADAHT